MDDKAEGRRTACIILLLVLLAFALRAAHLDFQSLWRDEVDALRFATRPFPELLSTFTRPGENGPLYFLLLRGWLALGGQSEFALRYLSLLGGVLAVPLTFGLGQRLAGRPTAWLAALFVATSPYLVWYSQEGKMYALLVSLVLAALWAFREALERGGWGCWALCWLLTTLALYVHVLAALLIAVYVVWFLIACLVRPQARQQLVPLLLVLALLTLPYLPIARWLLRLWQRPGFQTGHPFVPLGQMLNVLLWGFSRGVQGNSPLWTLLPFVFLLLAGAVLGWQKGVWALLSWLLLPPLALYLISLRKPLFADRYLIWTGPAFYMLLATGLTAVWRRWRPLAVALLALVVALNLQAVWGQAHTVIKSDFRRAAAYVEPRRAPDELLLFLMPYVRHTYAYYADDPTPWAEAPYTNDGDSPEEVAAEMARLTAGRSAVWLVSSEAELWDGRGLVVAWLEAHATPTDAADFVRVRVARYTLPPCDCSGLEK
ncbi:MAG: glycosyltransferase family 39 protein [Anaerolineae bacterium]|nr:glycosyltransferase family 39 protein [Anaerolineae bacterium]